MSYIKLIGIRIDDFSSSIEFEQNYSSVESKLCHSKKKELEVKGLICVVANITSNLKL